MCASMCAGVCGCMCGWVCESVCESVRVCVCASLCAGVCVAFPQERFGFTSLPPFQSFLNPSNTNIGGDHTNTSHTIKKQTNTKISRSSSSKTTMSKSSKLTQKCNNQSSAKRQWTDEDMEKAMALVKTTKMTTRQAALFCGVPRSTLWDRVSGKVAHGVDKRKRQQRRGIKIVFVEHKY